MARVKKKHIALMKVLKLVGDHKISISVRDSVIDKKEILKNR